MTIIPGIGLIILSTSNIMLALNNEITALIHDEKRNERVVSMKLDQLKKLSVSIVFQYIGVLILLISGVTKSIFSTSEIYVKWMLVIGIISITISIVILLIYSLRAVRIRQENLKK
jgi:uncharacterized membrane protein (DUF485 family)